ncbi:unnamed protein product [Lepeophtheirus salmonis]|uniref:(salmon louse) hypothetical protein n=1 Tax=Lepeophtheirus salmonis TaxID=72036 RepID=A0A7R8CP30_LEPSM|nr:unnamed protein product [Lepeophtheirus salmonis]CAF2882425.1 unnamed protein product [Lepeophtheirus salmonis]
MLGFLVTLSHVEAINLGIPEKGGSDLYKCEDDDGGLKSLERTILSAPYFLRHSDGNEEEIISNPKQPKNDERDLKWKKKGSRFSCPYIFQNGRHLPHIGESIGVFLFFLDQNLRDLIILESNSTSSSLDKERFNSQAIPHISANNISRGRF